MPIRFLSTGFLVLLLFAKTSFALGWVEIDKGLSYSKLPVSLPGRAVTLHAIKVNARQLKIRPVYPKIRTSVRKMAEQSQALVLVNANFFDTNSDPLGLVVIDKKTEHPLKDISWWAVFCVKRGNARIVHTRAYGNGLCHQAAQAGPRLVINGTIPKLKDENTRKTAVGINNRGEVILVVSEQRIPIKDLAAVFQRPEEQGGLGCPNAMNLDGGSSSQLYVKTDQLSVNVPSYVNFPVGLGVFRR